MKVDIKVLAFTLGVSLFFGVMCVALGTAFTPLMAIGGRLVCGSAEFGIDSQTYSYKPGQIGVTRSPYCLDAQTGEKRDVTFPLLVVDTILYGVIIFAGIVIVSRLPRRTKPSAPAAAGLVGVARRAPARSAPAQAPTISGSSLEKMKVLKQMHMAALITDQEYELKKAEILKGL